MRKNEPLLAIADQYDAFISSLRRSDGGARSRTPIVSLDAETNSVRLNPLANVTDEEMDRYIDENEIHVNPLHAQGYATIGWTVSTLNLPTQVAFLNGGWFYNNGGTLSTISAFRVVDGTVVPLPAGTGLLISALATLGILKRRAA